MPSAAAGASGPPNPSPDRASPISLCHVAPAAHEYSILFLRRSEVTHLGCCCCVYIALAALLRLTAPLTTSPRRRRTPEKRPGSEEILGAREVGQQHLEQLRHPGQHKARAVGKGGHVGQGRDAGEEEEGVDP